MKPIFVFTLICSAFLVYSFSIYLQPVSLAKSRLPGEGKLVWQKYNCQSCHQLFGLGGYLGPDLTNTYAEEGKGPVFIKAMVEVGTKQMPSFKMDETEMTALLAFLEAMNQTGKSDPRSFTIHANGMISQEK